MFKVGDTVKTKCDGRVGVVMLVLSRWFGHLEGVLCVMLGCLA